MTQNALDYSQNPSGADLMDVFLAGMADNQLTNHSGVSRPSYAKAGTFWIDTSASPWTLKQFTGTNDVTVGTLDQTNLYFTARRALGDKNGNDIATTYLTTTGTAAKATADANGNDIASTYLTTTGTAAKATADASGNTITSTYAKINYPMTAGTYASTFALTNNTTYKLTLTGNITFSLPTPTSTVVVNQILVQIYMSTARTINLGTSVYFGGEAPDLSEAGYYDLIYEYDNLRSAWVVGALKKASA